MIPSHIIEPGDDSERARFWRHVDTSGGPDACWPWKAAPGKDGYGKFWMASGKTVRAHRYAHAVTHGATNLLILHACDNPLCCNPKHLSAGTQKENRADCKNKGRTARGDRHPSRTRPERVLRGEAHPRAKMTEATVREIRRLRGEGMTIPAIATELGVTVTAAGFVVEGRTWRHIL